MNRKRRQVLRNTAEKIRLIVRAVQDMDYRKMKLALGVLLLVLSVISIGLAVSLRSKYKRSDLGIHRYEKAMKFEGGGTLHAYEIVPDLAPYEASQTCYLVQATGDIRSIGYFQLQTVIVKDVIRGEASMVSSMIEIQDYGFANDYRGLCFYSTINVLDPQREYLVFLEPLGNVNTYLERDVYTYDPLVALPVIPTDELRLYLSDQPEEHTSYQAMKSSDFFMSGDQDGKTTEELYREVKRNWLAQ